MTDLITAVSWDTMATAKPGPMMVVHPERQVLDDDLTTVGEGSGLNGPFLADLVASCATHERTGASLFKALEAQTNNPMAQRRFSEFIDDAYQAVDAYDSLMARLGIPGHYASPAARMTEAIDTRLVSAFLLAGSADQMTVELKGIEAVLLASTICVANASLLRTIADGLDEGSDIRTALEETVAAVEPASQKHLEWAATMQHEMVLGAANSTLAHKAGQVAEAVVGKVRDVLGR
jgi:hypothetical protein